MRSAERGFSRAAEALASIALPVCLFVLDWAKAEPARLFWIAEALGLFSVCAAFEATDFEVCFVLFATFIYLFLLWIQMSIWCLVKTKSTICCVYCISTQMQGQEGIGVVAVTFSPYLTVVRFFRF